MTDSRPPTRRPRPRRNNARGAASRQALLDAAVRLFSERGFRGTGIIGLANEVGMTHVGLLHHFGTKERLLREVVATRDSQLAEMVERVSAQRGIEAVATVRSVGPELDRDPVLSRLFCVLIAENLQPDDPLNSYFRDRYRQLREAFAGAMRDGQADGDIAKSFDADVIAAEIVAYIVGAQSMRHLEPTLGAFTPAFDAYTDRLLTSLRA